MFIIIILFFLLFFLLLLLLFLLILHNIYKDRIFTRLLWYNNNYVYIIVSWQEKKKPVKTKTNIEIYVN